MNGSEIVTFLSANWPTIGQIVSPAIGAVTGGLLTAIFLRHDTSTKEFEKIKAGKFSEVTEDLLESGKMTYSEYYKANNFLKIAQKADELYGEQAKNKSEIKPEHQIYDFDWFIRFYEAAGNISDEEMQKLWAKILSGETSHTGMYSLRSIDVLRNMSKSDANLFKHIYRAALSDNKNIYLPRYDQYLENNCIVFEDVLRLSEIGLINCSSNLVFLKPLTKDNTALCIGESVCLTACARNVEKTSVSINEFPFTGVGCELASLIPHDNTDAAVTFLAKQLQHSVDVDVEIGLYSIESYNSNEMIRIGVENMLAAAK